MSTVEQWLPVPGYEGYYEVSDQGRVRSLERVIDAGRGRYRRGGGHLLTPHVRSDGRRNIHLQVDRQSASYLVYVLVLSAFVGPRPDGMDACHNNGDPADDRLENLRWDTVSANILDSVRHGTHWAVKKTLCPRGHMLKAPNLRNRRDGRECLACHRARSKWRHARKWGRACDFEQIANDYYRAITSA